MQYADRRISLGPATVVIATRVSVENPSYQVSTARDGERARRANCRHDRSSAERFTSRVTFATCRWLRDTSARSTLMTWDGAGSKVPCSCIAMPRARFT